MKISRKVLIMAIAGVITAAGFGTLAATGTLKTIAYTATGHKLPNNEKPGVKAGTQTASPSPAVSPGATPTPAPTAKPTSAPQAATKYDYADGPCKGIHAADDGCVTKDATFRIASVIMWGKDIVCSGNSANVTFNTLMLTRYYNSGAGGNAQVQVDYSDGTSSPVLTLTFTPATNVQYYDGLSHYFANSWNASYRVRIISPNSEGSQNWMPIMYSTPTNCLKTSANPSPIPTPTP